MQMTNGKVYMLNLEQLKGRLELTRISILAAVLLSLFLSINTFAQKEKLPKGVVPPPLAVISKQEMKSLSAETRLKRRTLLAVTLMKARLDKAAEFTEDKEFQKSLNQLGSFYALMRNTLKFLDANEGQRGSFKNFKRFEMSLRKFLPKLALLRRKTPSKYGYHIRRLMKNVRDARSRAIEPLFGDTVIPEGKNR